MKCLLKVCASVFAIFNLNINLYAQKDTTLREKIISKVLYKGSFFSFYLNPYISQKAKCVRQSGDYPLNAAVSSGLEVGGNYFINFNNNYSLVVGAHAGFSGRNFILFIPKSDFSPNLENNIDFHGRVTKDYDLYLSAPVWFEKRWTRKNNSAWNADAGINIRYDPDDAYYYYDYGGIDVNGQPVLVLDLGGFAGNNQTPWLNYNIGGGYSIFLSNYNFLRINLVANISATRYINFVYTIDVTGKPQSTGTYSSNLSYVGLSIDYILTGTNKRLVNFYEKLSRRKIK
jgi:hypothetical protein